MPRSGTLGGTIGLAFLLTAACAAVGAYATIAPLPDADAMPLMEPLALHADEQAAPTSYVYEEQFQRGDTLAAFLGRLGLADGRLARLHSLRDLRPGTYVRS